MSARPSGPGALPRWASLVVEAAGEVIEFWGFKANHGRIWALLYLHGRPFTSAEIGQALGLSKGSISTATREMEHWGVLYRVRDPAAGLWTFVAETDFVEMIRRVVGTREARLVARVRADLERALELAREEAPREMVGRVASLCALAGRVERALGVFLKTTRLDLGGVLGGWKERQARRA